VVSRVIFSVLSFFVVNFSTQRHREKEGEHVREEGHGGHQWCLYIERCCLFFLTQRHREKEDEHVEEKGHRGHLWCLYDEI
jgi:hypothetical protein